MLWKVEVLLGHEYTLTEEVLVDLLAIGLWDKPIFINQSNGSLGGRAARLLARTGTYIVASSWRYSGNRFTMRVVVEMLVVEKVVLRWKHDLEISRKSIVRSEASKLLA